MKKIYLPLALAATLALGACSSDNVVDNGGSNPIDLSKGGLVKMSLNLPTDNNRGSRAELNDTLKDGLANEYGIKNAYLVLFEGGDDENAATIKGAYALSNSDFEAVGDDPNHVTLTKRIAFANDTKKPSESNKHIYALVVLNNNGLFTADVTNNIYTTEAEAKSKPAAEIYVERAVAKVTVQSKSKTNALEVNKNISYKLYNWAVDNTNKKSYIVRQYDNNWNKLYSDKAAGANKYRFVWDTPVNPNATETNKRYRTAFAQDPEYATTTDSTKYNQMANNASMTLKTTFGDNAPQYCNENTFQVTAQNQDQTTRVVLGVKMSAPGTTTYDADLYTVNDNKEVVYTKATLAERLKNILLQESDVKDWVAKHATDASFDITFDTNKAGETTITKATFKGKTTTPGATEETLESFTTNLNNALPNIVRYKGGVAYYAVRIKHFGDTDTPWNVEGQGVKAGDNNNIYPSATGANIDWFLGRYGVVRNNWYDISVNKIQTLGDATIPAFTNYPDDVLENYISVSINVLSWSKHTQGADL